METLPLFPLNAVLFPGVPLPLHIFEERYRTMIQYCLSTPSPFGVVLIESGPEVGGSAVPRRVGTSARILRSEKLDDGRYNLVACGERRFRIEELCQDRPYLTARVFWEDEDTADAPAPDLVAKVRAELGRYLDSLFDLLDQEPQEVELPGDPTTLSYVAAAVLQIGLEQKQALLEAASVAERLQAELGLLASEAEVQSTLRHLKPTLGVVTPMDPALSRRRFSLN